MNPRVIKVIYDGKCGFCQASVDKLKFMDWFKRLTYEPTFEPLTEMKVIDNDKTYGGFDAFRRLCWYLPLLYPALLLVYLPGIAIIGRRCYAIIAKRRYFLHRNDSCVVKNKRPQ